jgi:hypothetical protein
MPMLAPVTTATGCMFPALGSDEAVGHRAYWAWLLVYSSHPGGGPMAEAPGPSRSV